MENDFPTYFSAKVGLCFKENLIVSVFIFVFKIKYDFYMAYSSFSFPKVYYSNLIFLLILNLYSVYF